jgi:O-antigen ligase
MAGESRTGVVCSTSPGQGFEAHNMIVRILVEGGVVLLAVYLAYFYVVLKRLRRLARAPWELAGQARLMFVLWGLTLFAGFTTDDPISLTALMVGLLALTGALEGAWRARERSVPDPRSGVEAAPTDQPMFWTPAGPASSPTPR